MEGDGAYKAKKKKKEREKQTSLNSYSELPVRAAVVWDMWAGADVCVHLAEDVLILMEELGVSNPACICVRVESMSKALWLEEVGTS